MQLAPLLSHMALQFPPPIPYSTNRKTLSSGHRAARTAVRSAAGNGADAAGWPLPQSGLRMDSPVCGGLQCFKMQAEELKRIIEQGLPDAHVEVRDYTGGGDHFEALVVSQEFEGKTLVQRHQAVYAALGDAMRAQVHALTLKTLTPAQYQQRR
jgi:acid stress-induced BolA-like protein IbaG/YrbA